MRRRYEAFRFPWAGGWKTYFPFGFSKLNTLVSALGSTLDHNSIGIMEVLIYSLTGILESERLFKWTRAQGLEKEFAMAVDLILTIS